MNATNRVAPAIRRILSEPSPDPSAFWGSLGRAEDTAADLQLMRDAFTATARTYECACGGGFVFEAGMGLEEYAALNRWLGHHGRCHEVEDLWGAADLTDGKTA